MVGHHAVFAETRLEVVGDSLDQIPRGLAFGVVVKLRSSPVGVGYHADWAKNFPFGALGLNDKYEVAPASITAFGFSYDEDLVSRLGGELWPGVGVAEQEVRTRAQVEGVTTEIFRTRLHQRYLENAALAR